jgi:hypothetical protein
MDHPPYSPDLTLCNFLASSKIKKKSLKGLRFAVPDIQHNVMLLRDIVEYDFQDCFQQWHYHLMKCIASQGEYFKGKGIKLSHLVKLEGLETN